LLVASWDRYGINASFEELYHQEKALYGVFTTGVSYLESLTYATYIVCTAVLSHVCSFGSDKDRHDLSDPARLAKRLSKAPSARNLAAALHELSTSPEWKMWKAYRNTHSHRSSPPRLVRMSLGSAPPPPSPLQLSATWSTPALEADSATFDSYLEALRRFAAQIMAATSGLPVK